MDSSNINNRPTILVSEDDESQLSLVSRFLRKNGYVVNETEDGKAAVKSFLDDKPDLILLDAKMPVMDGFQACETIRTLPGGRQVPIVMVTALSDDESVDMAFESGAEDFITKPIHWAVLRQRIRILLERKHAEEHIRHQATHDGLTGLPNRTLFMDRLESALAMGRRNSNKIGLMFVDLDRFKWVNDEFGHIAGDQLLQEVSSRMLDCVRQSDTVARLGGDEFTVILSDASGVDNLAAIAEKILQRLQEPFLLAGREVTISGSIGVTVYPTDGDDVEDLIRNADDAMYIAKNRGRNCYYFFDSSMAEQSDGEKES
jgi:diguanylate cyclase (GGDEF)-like protein